MEPALGDCMSHHSKAGSSDGLGTDDLTAFRDFHPNEPGVSRNFARPSNTARLNEKGLSNASVRRSDPPSVVTGFGYERSLLDARLSLRSNCLDLPWESGILKPQSLPSMRLNRIFVRPELPSIETYLQASAKDLAIERERTVKRATFPSAVRRLRDLTPTETADTTRRKACQMWLHIISISPESSATGRLCDMVAHLRTDNDMLELIDRVLTKKAPGTMLKRASSFMKFVLFCRKAGKAAVPLSEPVANDYCEHLMSCKSTAATTISSFIQSVNFMGFTLQFDNFKDISNSGRVKGAADRMALKKRYPVQSDVYTVDDITWMTQFVCNELEDPLDRLFIGDNLFCIFARSRWGDHQHIVNLCWDTSAEGIGFVTGEADHIKTSNTVKNAECSSPLQHLSGSSVLKKIGLGGTAGSSFVNISI